MGKPNESRNNLGPTGRKRRTRENGPRSPTVWPGKKLSLEHQRSANLLEGGGKEKRTKLRNAVDRNRGGTPE